MKPLECTLRAHLHHVLPRHILVALLLLLLLSRLSHVLGDPFVVLIFLLLR